MTPQHDYSDIGGDSKSEREREREQMVDEVQMALLKEVKIFNRREDMIAAFRVSKHMIFSLNFITVQFLHNAITLSAQCLSIISL